jgi:hypothetical protein
VILKLHGEVDAPYPDSCEVYIGKESVTEEIQRAGFDSGHEWNDPPKVLVAIAGEKFAGDLYCLDYEPSWSEWTPGWCCELTVGEHDLVKILHSYHGKVITMYMADEPINTLEDSTEGPIDWEAYGKECGNNLPDKP